MNPDEKVQLIWNFNEDFRVKEYVTIVDFNGMTPLVLFIVKYFKEIKANLPKYRSILSVLSPAINSVPTSFANLTKLKLS